MHDKIAAVNQGRTANLALEILGPEMDAVRTAAIARMKHMYRDGSATELRLLAAVAELCALDDLESRLKARIRRGDQSLKELHNDG